MLLGEALICPNIRINIPCIAIYPMISNKNKNGVLEIAFFFSCFYKLLKTEIEIAESIVLFLRFKAIAFQFFFWQCFHLKLIFISRNGKRPVVIGSLNDGEEGLFL